MLVQFAHPALPLQLLLRRRAWPGCSAALGGRGAAGPDRPRRELPAAHCARARPYAPTESSPQRAELQAEVRGRCWLMLDLFGMNFRIRSSAIPFRCAPAAQQAAAGPHEHEENLTLHLLVGVGLGAAGSRWASVLEPPKWAQIIGHKITERSHRSHAADTRPSGRRDAGSL